VAGQPAHVALPLPCEGKARHYTDSNALSKGILLCRCGLYMRPTHWGTVLPLVMFLSSCVLLNVKCLHWLLLRQGRITNGAEANVPWCSVPPNSVGLTEPVQTVSVK